MKNLKIHIKRIIKLTPKPNQPDYEGFFSAAKGDYHVVGYLKPLNSNLDLTITKVTSETLLKNRFLMEKYSNWRTLKKK